MPDTIPCTSCRQSVIMAIIHRRDGEISRMPVNPRPAANGNVAASKDVHGNLHGKVLGKNEKPEPGQQLYATHFMTCVAADLHRTSRGKKPPQPPADISEDHQTALF